MSLKLFFCNASTKVKNLDQKEAYQKDTHAQIKIELFTFNICSFSAELSTLYQV